MGIAKIAHYSVRTTDLAASTRFYTEVLGFRDGYRPPFNFPGAWLYASDDESEYGIVHLIGVDGATARATTDYLGERPETGSRGSGLLDHIAFQASDWPGMKRRCDALGVQFVERFVPDLNIHQVFLVDPSGVTIELNFAGEAIARA